MQKFFEGMAQLLGSSIGYAIQYFSKAAGVCLALKVMSLLMHGILA